MAARVNYRFVETLSTKLNINLNRKKTLTLHKKGENADGKLETSIYHHAELKKKIIFLTNKSTGGSNASCSSDAAKGERYGFFAIDTI